MFISDLCDAFALLAGTIFEGNLSERCQKVETFLLGQRKRYKFESNLPNVFIMRIDWNNS